MLLNLTAIKFLILLNNQKSYAARVVRQDFFQQIRFLDSYISKDGDILRPQFNYNIIFLKAA